VPQGITLKGTQHEPRVIKPVRERQKLGEVYTNIFPLIFIEDSRVTRKIVEHTRKGRKNSGFEAAWFK